MSYARPRKTRFVRPQGLGDFTDIASAAVNVSQDPCLGQVIAYIQQIYAAESGGPSTGVSVPTGPGIGLCKVVTPLSIAAYVATNPLVAAIGAVGVLGLLVGIGYSMGSD